MSQEYRWATEEEVDKARSDPQWFWDHKPAIMGDEDGNRYLAIDNVLYPPDIDMPLPEKIGGDVVFDAHGIEYRLASQDEQDEVIMYDVDAAEAFWKESSLVITGDFKPLQIVDGVAFPIEEMQQRRIELMEREAENKKDGSGGSELGSNL